MGRDLEDLMQQPVIHDHADEGLGGEQRVHLPERAFLGTAGDVAGQEFIKHPVPVPEEHVREFVSFECAEEQQAEQRRIGAPMDAEAGDEREDPHVLPLVRRFLDGRHELGELAPRGNDRSEEHTSELQSRLHLVCRLLLEKKKNLYHPSGLSHATPVLPKSYSKSNTTSAEYGY